MFSNKFGDFKSVDNKKSSKTKKTTETKNSTKENKKDDKKNATKKNENKNENKKKMDKKQVKDKERQYTYQDGDDDSDDEEDDDDYYSDDDEEDDDDSEDIEDTEDEDDDESDDEEYETVDEEDDEDESDDEEEDNEKRSPPCTPVKKSRRRIIIDDDEDEEDEDEDDEKKGKVSKYELRKTVSEIFPSKYMKDRVKKTKKEDEKKSKNTKKTKKAHRRTKDDDDNDEDEDDDDDDDDEDNDHDKKKDSSETSKNKGEKGFYNILLSLDEPLYDPDEEDEEEYKEDNEECDSDDEKKFMKEKYQFLEIPEDSVEKDKKEKRLQEKENRKKNASKKSKSKKANTTASSDNEPSNIEDEYLELLDTKRELIEQLNKKPNSKVFRNAIDECNRSIKKLVQKNRTKNAKNYHKLIHGSKKPVNETDYFKKNLSNKEQLHIMKDLKEINKLMNTEKPQRLTLLETNMPTKFKSIALQKLDTLKYMEPGDSEYFKIKSWVDTFMRIPFGFYKSLSVKMDDGIDVCHDFMEKSMKTLDNCVYGLKDAKIQIMQLVGQWISNPSSIGTAIAIHGPPGCGKTSLVKDGISKILGREFAFIALGGTGDSSFLEGHSYTYEGSTCGRIVQILIESKSMNPVIYFDELDKISDTPRGEEIANVLTHLTDTTQNSEFHDKYFAEFDFDLSKCLFIFSYNDESKVNPILKDRMYRIETKGYEVKEKIIIARNYLLPKIREHVKFSDEDVIISDDIIQYIVSNSRFTKGEAGVRNLKRCLEIIFTKLNLFRLTKPETNIFGKEIDIKVEFPFTVTKASVDVFIKGEENQNMSLLAMYV